MEIKFQEFLKHHRIMTFDNLSIFKFFYINFIVIWVFCSSVLTFQLIRINIFVLDQLCVFILLKGARSRCFR